MLVTTQQEEGRTDLGMVSLLFLFLFLVFLVGGGVVHVALGLGELHLVHALAGVPVEEGLAAEHGGELLADPVEHLLDGEGGSDTRAEKEREERETTYRVALYGSTTVSETFGDGKTEKVSIMRSGYSSLILEMRRVPMPDPVPPPTNGKLGILCRHEKGEKRTNGDQHRIQMLFIYLEDSHNSRPPCGQRRGLNQSAQRPPCSDPWPSYSGTGLPEHEVIRTEDLAKRSGADGHRPGNVPPPTRFIVVHVDAL
ncbi:unnamed protein product [Spirodela intermedia]|uniref:Uncharacterized protein n=1 Tax=Spirodela intermedia TaxID=51605 RepID=A0A7I8JIF1_SPIIN|nr:unnamed protein product [Spirodela intermedia]CAA6669938.1 unnamed protein product [Spirodela intermedia]